MAVTPHRPAEPRRPPRPQRLQLAQVRPPRRKLVGRAAFIALLFLATVTGSLAGLMLVYSVNLPQINDLEHYRPSTTTDLYDRKGRLIGSFALERREVVGYDGFAPILRQAVISIEDKNFESHWGINVFRVIGAAWHDIRSHGRAQGASTLTMQLAGNLFLSSDRTMVRKIQEAYLAIQTERAFTKQQIFTLYGNQIYLGSGMYGFEAASEFYFSRRAKDLTLPEAALLAGLPKAPFAFSPLLYPDKALRRRNLVITEMEHDKVITPEQAEEARNTPLGLHISQPEMSVAPWFQEEVRRELEKRFGVDQVHEDGLKVETTLDLDLQKAANQAVADGLATYERRHGWKGKLENMLEADATLDDYKHPDWATESHPGDYVHALVTRVLPLQIHARVGSSQIVLLPEDWQWTGARYGTALVKPGDIIYVHLGSAMEGSARRAALEQDSGAQGALMAIDNTTGDMLAMVGGRDYALSQFNRATQAERQVGSSFKPYVYTAAIEDGVKPGDIVMDTPVSFGSYTPHDYENNFLGAMTVANAFADSRNIPALRLAAHVGIGKVVDVAHRFGITSDIPAYLPIALGAASITLQEQVDAYAVFPNDGIRVTPRLIRKVSNPDGITLWEDSAQVSEVIDQKTARTMMTLLQDVTQHGTGSTAAQLHHPLGGKTGTTSDFTDAWFLGFSPSVTCGVWVGYDNNQSLGDKETGAAVALPIWINVMRVAIAGKDGEQFPGDEPAATLDEASAQPSTTRAPGRPGAAPQSAPLARPTAHSTTGALLPPATPPRNAASQPAARAAAQQPNKPSLSPSTASPVRQALPAPPPQVRPALSVRPALEDTSTPHHP